MLAAPVKAAHALTVIIKIIYLKIYYFYTLEGIIFMTTKEVWNQYSEDVKRFIISKVKENTVADDILQDTFIKIHTKLHTLKDSQKLKSWVFTIARNSTLDFFKTSKINYEVFDLGEEDDIEKEYHTEKDCLYGILQKLPKKYRTPLFLSDIKGMKQSDVAKQLNQNLPTTKSQIQRARKLIAQGFIDCCGFVMNEQGHLVGEIQEKENCKVCN